jgi:hypothetical protein
VTIDSDASSTEPSPPSSPITDTEKNSISRGQCYDFINIFDEKIGGKIGDFDCDLGRKK